jgi:RNA ligase (TIGR02306 family)
MFKASRGNLGPLWRLTPEDVEEDRRIERNWRWANKPIIRWVLRKLKKKVQKPRNYRTNLYVGIAINQGLIEKVETLGREIGQRIDLFGEVFGAGVQKLDYGQKTPTFRAFDIAIDRKFADEEEKVKWFARLGVERLPVLYRGPWNETALIQHRDGKTVISGTNIREGVVVTAIGDQSARETHNGRRLRPFLKMVSPAYLAKEDGSEIQ